MIMEGSGDSKFRIFINRWDLERAHLVKYEPGPQGGQTSMWITVCSGLGGSHQDPFLRQR